MNRDWKEGELAYIRIIVHEADLKLILNKKKKIVILIYITLSYRMECFKGRQTNYYNKTRQNALLVLLKSWLF